MIFGTAGVAAPTVEGFCGLLKYREVNDERLVLVCGKVPGGLAGFLGRVSTMHISTRKARWQCVAATATELYNQGARSGRLPSWW